jgi:RNA polymerase sigma-70 factor (ECF subfamily)
MDEHAAALHTYVLRLMLGDVHRAEDIVQETFLRAWIHRELLAGPPSVRPWLLRVARDLSADYHRRQATGPVEVPIENTLDVADDSALDRLEQILHRQSVVDLLRRLSLDHREVLVMLYCFGLSQDEVARALEIAPGTVRSRAHDALAQIRRTARLR